MLCKSTSANRYFGARNPKPCEPLSQTSTQFIRLLRVWGRRNLRFLPFFRKEIGNAEKMYRFFGHEIGGLSILNPNSSLTWKKLSPLHAPVTPIVFLKCGFCPLPETRNPLDPRPETLLLGLGFMLLNL